VDVERASRESPYGGTTAHGYLTLSLLPALAIDVGLIPVDARAGLYYGLDKVRFVAPVKTGVRVRNRMVLLAADDKGDGRVLLKTDDDPVRYAQFAADTVGEGSHAVSWKACGLTRLAIGRTSGLLIRPVLVRLIVSMIPAIHSARTDGALCVGCGTSHASSPALIFMAICEQALTDK
jgi:MaoC like domain